MAELEKIEVNGATFKVTRDEAEAFRATRRVGGVGPDDDTVRYDDGTGDVDVDEDEGGDAVRRAEAEADDEAGDEGGGTKGAKKANTKRRTVKQTQNKARSSSDKED